MSSLEVALPAPRQPAPAATAEPWSVEVDALTPRAWDELLAGFEDASYEQSACVLDAQWGENRGSHLVLRRRGKAVAAARLVILTAPGFKRGIAYVKFGPVWRPKDESPDPELHRRVVKALIAEYCEGRGHCLTVLPRPHPGHTESESTALAELGFAQRRPMLDPNRYLVDVALDSDTRMKALDQKWRYNLRKALKGGIVCRLGEGPADREAFQALHGVMEERKSIRQQAPVHLLARMEDELPEGMRPQVVLAFHEGQPVAGAVVATLGDTAYYVFGATSDAALFLKAGYALQWWILGWLWDTGARWYDLGGEVLEPGLRQFKKGLVGKAGAVVPMPGEFDRWSDLRGRFAADLLYRMRDARRVLASFVNRS